MTPLRPSTPLDPPLLLEDVPWRRKGAEAHRVWLREPVESRIARMGPWGPAAFPPEFSGEGVCLCRVCKRRRRSGFWFVRGHRDGQTGWVGWASEEGQPCVGAMFVCLDCGLQECLIVCGYPPEAWSADRDERGEEPRLSRILRECFGSDRGACP